MEMSRVKDGNYYVVQSFMVKDLKLKGLEKDVYAIIYGFSQAEDQTFTGSLQYLADWTCASKQAIMNALKKLVDKQLLIKKEKFVNNVKFVEYSPTDWTSIQENCTGVSKKIVQVENNVDGGIQESCIPPIQETCTNNLDYNLVNNKEDNIINNIELDKQKINNDKSAEAQKTIVSSSRDLDEVENFIEEPNALVRELINCHYITELDLRMNEFNQFVKELVNEYGFEQVRSCVWYFVKNQKYYDKPDDKLAYFKASIENGLKRLNTEYDPSSIPEGLSWLLQ